MHASSSDAGPRRGPRACLHPSGHRAYPGAEVNIHDGPGLNPPSQLDNGDDFAVRWPTVRASVFARDTDEKAASIAVGAFKEPRL